MAEYDDVAKLFQTGGQSWAVPYTPGNATAPAWGSSAAQPSWWGNTVGAETLPGAGGGYAGFDANVAKALGTLAKSSPAQAAGGGSGGPAVGAMAPAQSGTGTGRGPSLDTLVKALMDRYQGLLPGGGGGGKGLLGV